MMKSPREIRSVAREAMWKHRWIGPALAVVVFSITLTLSFSFVWETLVKMFGVVTWEDFNLAKMQALASGMDYSVPSRQAAFMMTSASIIKAFFQYFVSGAVAFAFSAVSLSAVTDAREAWLKRSLAAFANPFSVAALAFLQYMLVFLWSLLLVVPGIVAAYRYSMAWFLKSENPSWGALKCINESKRLTGGRKMALFKLDCSYFWALLAVLISLLPLMYLVGTSSRAAEELEMSAALLASALAASMTAILVSIYMNLGRAVFYRCLAGKDGACTRTSPM